jgi:hypothetical protein
MNGLAALPLESRQHPHPDLPPQFERRVLIEGDAIDIGDGQPGAVKTVTQRSGGKGVVVLDSAEALFLNGRNNLAIPQQTAGGIMIARRDADNVQDAPGFTVLSPSPVHSIRVATAITLMLISQICRARKACRLSWKRIKSPIPPWNVCGAFAKKLRGAWLCWESLLLMLS